MSQQDVTVTPVRVYVQHGVDRTPRSGHDEH